MKFNEMKFEDIKFRNFKPATEGYCDYLDGYHWVFEFPNGYGASVVCNEVSYGHNDGLFELAVIKGGDICYDTPVTNDVVGYLTADEVADYLAEIRDL